jgi:hypothetical protein
MFILGVLIHNLFNLQKTFKNGNNASKIYHIFIGVVTLRLMKNDNIACII